ncbi:MAG TPA: TolC family protein, partial [Abditibacteriaceae bacterium]|nr:TolC family protein [Abditibacteriaceae bacterium]
RRIHGDARDEKIMKLPHPKTFRACKAMFMAILSAAYIACTPIACTPALAQTLPPAVATPTPVPVAPAPVATAVPSAAVTTAAVLSQEPLTLEESIALALRNHGDVSAAQQGFVSAREGITSARSALYPQVNANLNYDYQGNNNRNSNPTPGGTPFPSTFRNSSTATNIGASYNIFDGGRTRTQVRQAHARALNAVGGVGSTRSNLAFQVAQNFYEQLRQEKLVAQRQGQIELARQQLEQIQAQVEAGTAARVDTQSVQVNLIQARFDMVTAQNALRVAQTNFRNSLGLGRGPDLKLQESPLAVEVTPAAAPPEAIPPAPNAAPTPLPFPIAPAAPLPIVPTVQSLDEYLVEARRLRPDLLQARANVQQTEASVVLAKIASRPQITATAGYNLDPRSTRDRGLIVGAGVSIPLFDAGGRKADVRGAQADLESNRIRLAQLDKDVAADVESSFVDIGGEVERIANARALVEAARTNLETATEKYRLGLGIVLDIVNAQTQLFNAQTSLTQAVYDYELARSNLDRAVGRFAWADPGQAPPPAAPATVPQAVAVAAPSGSR